jgi:hypothetical protein
MPSRRWLYILALGGCLVASGGTHAQQSPAQAQPQQEQQVTPQKRAADQGDSQGILSRARRLIDPSGSPPASPPYEPKAEEWKDHRENEDMKAQVAMADYAFGILLITLLQLPIGIFTLIYLARTFSVTRNTSLAELRAYVSVAETGVSVTHGLEVVEGNLTGKIIVTVECAITIRNAGVTPARNLRTRARVVVAEHPLPSKFSVEPFGENASQLTVGSNTNHDVLLPKWALGDEQVKRIRDKTAAVYVYGWAEYNDMFTKKPRETHFCLWTTDLGEGTHPLHRSQYGNEET